MKNEAQQRTLGYVIIGVIAYLVVARANFTSDDLTLIALLIPTIIIHEVSHGAVAYLFGDDTAKRAGRLTLNPIKHIDIFGTIVLPILLVLNFGHPFGYAKPVPVSLSRLRNPRLHGLFVGLAGPGSNLLMAASSLVIMQLMKFAGVHSIQAYKDAYFFGLVNIWIGVFNLLPIPPLDGASIVEFFLPRNWQPAYYQFRRYAMFVLIALVLMGNGVLGKVLDRMQTPFRSAYETQVQHVLNGLYQTQSISP